VPDRTWEPFSLCGVRATPVLTNPGFIYRPVVALGGDAEHYVTAL
jgi:hypothetical protein